MVLLKLVCENEFEDMACRPKRLELPQWVQQQTKIQATKTAALAELCELAIRQDSEPSRPLSDSF